VKLFLVMLAALVAAVCFGLVERGRGAEVPTGCQMKRRKPSKPQKGKEQLRRHEDTT